MNPLLSPYTPLNGHMIKGYAIFLKPIFFLGHPVYFTVKSVGVILPFCSVKTETKNYEASVGLRGITVSFMSPTV